MRNKLIKMTLTLMAIFIMSMAQLLVVSAAGNPISYDKFDEAYYAARNPDVVLVLGNTKKALYNHYSTAGIVEGRAAREYRPSRLTYINSKNFDSARYAADYPDVAAVVGNTKASLWKHYTNIGMYDGHRAYTNNQNTNAILKCFDVVESITNDAMSDREKARAIHDWICNNMDYDNSFQASSHTLAGAMFNGLAVCEGFSRSFQTMAEIAGLQSEIVSGYANNGYSSGGHAWNKVYIDGQWSYIDSTWDDFTSDFGQIIYACFMISEEEMNRIHNGCIAHFMNGQFEGYY